MCIAQSGRAWLRWLPQANDPRSKASPTPLWLVRSVLAVDFWRSHPRLQAADIEVARRGGARIAPAVDHQDVAGRAFLHRLGLDRAAVLGAGAIHVLARGDEAHGEGDADQARLLGPERPNVEQRHA